MTDTTTTPLHMECLLLSRTEPLAAELNRLFGAQLLKQERVVGFFSSRQTLMAMVHFIAGSDPAKVLFCRREDPALNHWHIVSTGGQFLVGQIALIDDPDEPGSVCFVGAGLTRKSPSALREEMLALVDTVLKDPTL